MIAINRSDIYAMANTQGIASNGNVKAVQPAQQSLYQSGVAGTDTVTISAAARDLANGNSVEKVADTYGHLASSGLVVPGQITVPSVSEQVQPVAEIRGKPEIDIDNFYEKALQSILDNRMGLDKEKLKEIEAMMEEVANDDSLSPEQKTKKLEELQKLMDEVIEESIEKLKHQTQEQETNLQ